MQTKYKPISKIETPAEVKMTSSQRVGGAVVEEQVVVKSSNENSVKELAFLWIFLAVGTLLIYWAMHPTSKV